jgi:hypothetical protein
VEQFVLSVQDAEFALENLPGYTYAVTDPQGGPGFTLRGIVAGPDRREWRVHELGAPERVVARWVRLGEEGYTDVRGRWEALDDVPFDRSPLSFGGIYSGGLIESGGFGPGEKLKITRTPTKIGGRDAVRHEMVQQLGGLESGPGSLVGEPGAPGSPTEQKTTMWVAKQGGYLLRLETNGLDADPGVGRWVVEVSPLRLAPSIQAPTVGASAFPGKVPPWRVAVIARDRLRGLRSYAFEIASNPSPVRPVFRVSGQVSNTQGRLSGVMTDVTAMGMMEVGGETSPPKLPQVKADLIYVGPKAWASTRGGRYHRTSLTHFGPTSQAEFVFPMLLLIPGGPPAELVPREFAGGADLLAFGLVDPFSSPLPTRNRLVGEETVNGVRALHYQGTLTGSPDRRADTWVAVDGLHLVRFRVTSAADEDRWMFSFYGGPSPDRIEIRDVNKPFTVKPPSP